LVTFRLKINVLSKANMHVMKSNISFVSYLMQHVTKINSLNETFA